MRRSADRPGAVRLPAGLAAGLLVLLAALCALGAAPPRAAAVFHADDDWRHVKAVLAALERHPGVTPIVYLLGGSSARECTVSDADWRAEIARLGAPDVRACNFGSASQSYAQGITVVQRSPQVPTIVLIGVNVGRYTPPYQEDTTATAEPPKAAKGAYDQHRFLKGGLPDSVKLPLVGKWLRERYPVFKKRYAHHAALLPQLVEACRERGFHPVVVELPLNLPIVGDAWDAPRARYRAGCRAVARKYDIPYIDFVGDLHLVSADFYDLSHLVSPGRVKWQHRLSHLIVTRLRQYHVDPITPQKESAPDNG
ncbi:MAG: SGNH/GDSL hydrolase family protein [Actinomycetes bacterium]